MERRDFKHDTCRGGEGEKTSEQSRKNIRVITEKTHGDAYNLRRGTAGLRAKEKPGGAKCQEILLKKKKASDQDWV